MPRAATSVATSVLTLPEPNAASARSRWFWDLLPCIATARTPCAAEALDEPVGAALGAHEDERELGVVELLDQRVDAAVAVDGAEAVLDLAARSAAGGARA